MKIADYIFNSVVNDPSQLVASQLYERQEIIGIIVFLSFLTIRCDY